MRIRTMFKCLCVITALGMVATIGAYASGKYGTFQPRYMSAKMQGKAATKTRPNCEDLGRCNLKTGEVFDYAVPEQAPYQVDASGHTTDPAAYVYLFNDQGEV